VVLTGSAGAVRRQSSEGKPKDMTSHTCPAKIVIVGGGHGGVNAASLLRQAGYLGAITLVSEEAFAPYNRPPLSKAYLKGETSADSLKLRSDKYYREKEIALLLDTRAVSIDRAAKVVYLQDPRQLDYDVLLLATGSRARTLPISGCGLSGVHQMRTIDDARRLRGSIGQGKTIVAIGAGYIGLEVASVVRDLGSAVTVIERESRVLSRVASSPVSEFLEGHYVDRGVRFIFNANVHGLEGGAAGHVTDVRLDDGRVIPCDAVLIGVGGLANDELARASGLSCENGIMVDEFSRTSDPSIYAIGDVACRPLPLSGNRMWRLESVPNAVEGARQAVASILGQAPPKPEVPWFWSDQGDLKLQIAGVPFDVDEIVRRGKGNKFSVYHLNSRQLVAVETVNSAAEFIKGKQYIADRRTVCDGQFKASALPPCDQMEIP